MAYMNQEQKKLLAPGIKKVLKKYGLRGTIGVRHHSGLVVNIWEGKLDFIGNKNKNMAQHKIDMYGLAKDYLQVNEYHIDETYSGQVKECLNELKAAMNGCQEIQNHDNSDLMTDYFDIGWYTYIRVGEYNKPYKYNGGK
tara:strand:+ start:442 stop:861 length:420 start_codon:yes stop_codon:yes gene_type:complete